MEHRPLNPRRTPWAHVLMCLVLSMSLLGYGLDIGCAFSLTPCQTAECCSDCGVSPHLTDRPNQVSHLKLDPLYSSQAEPVLIVGDTLTGRFDFQDHETVFIPRHVRRTDHTRGPPVFLAS